MTHIKILKEEADQSNVFTKVNRIAGIDIARGIAILGMFVLHSISTHEASPYLTAGLAVFADQRAQILFAVLDGVSIGILTNAGAARQDKQVRGFERRKIALRGIYLIALGLFLTTLGSPIIVILDYYGVYFLLILPFVYMKRKSLFVASAIFLLAGPPISDMFRSLIGDPSVNGNEILPPTIDRIASWILVGQYPAVVWLGYVFLGLAIYRIGIMVRPSQLEILKVSIPVSVLATAAGYLLRVNYLTVQTVILIGSAGIAVTITVGAIFIADNVHSEFSKYVKTVFYPIMIMGSMPVTIYFLHVVYFAILAEFTPIGKIQGIDTFLVITFGGAIFAGLYLRFFQRGPFEALVRAITPARDELCMSRGEGDR